MALSPTIDKERVRRRETDRMAQAESRAQPKGRPPSAAIRGLAICTATLPLWYNNTPYAILNPLFSSAPTNAIPPRVVAYMVLFTVFLATRVFPVTQSDASWRTCWLVIALWKLVSPALLEATAESLLRLGLEHGIIAGRILLGGLSTLAIWTWLLNSLTCIERSRLFPPYVLLALYAGSFVSHLEIFSFTTLPECYTLHVHGLLLAAVALFAPCLEHPVQARGRPHSNHPFAIMNASASTKTATLTLALLVAFVASRMSRHCPLSPAEPDSTGILASRKSVTGWISVGEHTMPQADGARGDMTMRYLRADHSLLGGLWIGPSRDTLASKHGGQLNNERAVVRYAESIYSTFILQELVRLVIRPAELPHAAPEQGLIIGLGAGLSARALAQHGVNLTVVEIDPVVYDYAVEYFAVDDAAMGEVVLEDAVAWAGRQDRPGHFDYIVHDVFTGGAVPASLFRLDFLQQLSTLLHPTGVLALNFAGDFNAVSSTMILTTVHRVFPRCRAFSDSETSSAYSNIVILCTKDWYVGLELRDPVQADFLPYPSPAIREQVLSRFRSREVDIARFKRKADSVEGDAWLIRTDGDVRKVEREQLQDVGVHWTVMRDVLPEKVWARW